MSLRVSSIPPDRRASRLLTMAQRSDSFGPVEIAGLDALALVITVYGPERLCGHGSARISDRALRDAIRRIAAEARAEDPARAERMLIALRQAWLQMPAVRHLSHDSPRTALWDRIVTLCCEEFYAPAADGVPEQVAPQARHA
jgi:hypothetical protein